MSEGPPKLRVWWALLALAVFAAGHFVPLPGVGHETLRTFGSDGGLLDLLTGLFNLPAPLPGLNLFGAGAGMLATVSVLFMFVTRGRRSQGGVTFVVVVAMAGITGSAMMLHTAQLRTQFGELVEVSRAVAITSWIGGAAVLFVLARTISATGIGFGPLVLVGAAALWRLVETSYAAGYDEMKPALARTALATAPFVLVLVSLWLWRDPPRPVRLPLTRLDQLLLPALASVVVSRVVYDLVFAFVTFSGASFEDGLRWLPRELPVIAAGAAALAVTTWRAVRSPRGKEWGAWGFAAGALALAALPVGATFWSVRSTQERQFPANPRGDAQARVVLKAAGSHADASGDGELLVLRLRRLGVEAKVARSEAGSLELEVRGARDPKDAVARVLAPGNLRFHFAADQAPLVALARRLGGGLHVKEHYQGRKMVERVHANTEASLAPLLRALPANDRTFAAVECRDDFERADDPQRCTAWLLRRELVVDNAGLADVRVRIDEQRNRPYLALDFTPAAAERFADQTGQNVGENLVVLIDGRINSAPVVMDRIGGGRAQITLGGALKTYQELLVEAGYLARSLSVGALRGPWTIAAVHPLEQ